MQEDNKIIAAIADEIADIKKQISILNDHLSSGTKLTSENLTQKELDDIGQMIVDLNLKLDGIMAKQTVPKLWLLAFGILGILLGIEIVLKTILINL